MEGRRKQTNKQKNPTHLSPGSSVAPKEDPPQRMGRCTPPPLTHLHHHLRSPLVVEEVESAPQTPARQLGEAVAALLKLQVPYIKGGNSPVREAGTTEVKGNI